MSAADTAASALRDRVQIAIDPVRQAITGLQQPVRALSDAVLDEDTLTATCRAAARIVLAAEALKTAAAEMDRAGRDALAECFADTGSLGVRIDGFTVIPSTSAAAAVITGTVPPEWMSTPEPTPDRKRIAAALRDGQDVPNATLSNSRPTVSFRPRKDVP